MFEGERIADGLPVVIKVIGHYNIPSWGCADGHPVPLELELLQQVKDVPGVVRVIDFGNIGNLFHIVMPRMPNCIDLFTYIHTEGPLEERLAMKFFIQVLRITIACYKRGVVHLDIKDENLLVDRTTKKLTLIDFGAGAYVQNEDMRRHTGTRLFAPPEWISQGRFRAEPMTVWSLGILLFKMLSGGMLFRSESEIMSGLTMRPMSPVPLSCRNILFQMLKSDEAMRPSLNRLMDTEWVIVGIDEEEYRVWRGLE